MQDTRQPFKCGIGIGRRVPSFMSVLQLRRMLGVTEFHRLKLS